MTALLVAEHCSLDDTVTYSETATHGLESGAATVQLDTGDTLSVRDSLYALLLKSACEVANGLAEKVSGTQAAFAELMNQRAQQLGCTNTHFANASGLNDTNHYTTAYDMALITKAAFDNETVRKIAGTAEYTIPATNMSEERKLATTNFFLTGIDKEIDGKKIKVDKYEGVFGGKTGYVGENKASMVTGLDVDGLEVYCLVMGSESAITRYSDIKAMMDYGKANVSKYTVFVKDDAFGEVKLRGGADNRVTAVAADDGFINLPEGVSASLVTTECVFTDNLTAPVEKGQRIGVVHIYVADELKSTIDLLAAENIEEGWFLSPYGISNLQTVIIGIVLGLLLIALIAIMTLRISNKRKQARIRKRKLEEEARKQLAREEDRKRRDWRF